MCRLIWVTSIASCRSFPFDSGPLPNVNVSLLLLKCWRNIKRPFRGSLPLLFTQRDPPSPNLAKGAWPRGCRIYSNFQEHLELPITHACLICGQSLMLLVKPNCWRNYYDTSPHQHFRHEMVCLFLRIVMVTASYLVVGADAMRQSHSPPNLRTPLHGNISLQYAVRRWQWKGQYFIFSLLPKPLQDDPSWLVKL